MEFFNNLMVGIEVLKTVSPLQWVLAFIGYLTIYLSMISKNHKDNYAAPFIGLLGQPFWLYLTFTNHLFGMFLVCSGYTFFYAAACWKNLKLLTITIDFKTGKTSTERFDPHAR